MNKNGPHASALDGFGHLDPQAVKSIIAASSDIALLVTRDGIVQDVYVGPDMAPANDVTNWSGARLQTLVSEESRAKVTDMLARAGADEAPRWREINHLGDNFPVRYAAVRTGDSGDIILLGRDLRMVAQLQQRLVQAQLTMEQDYERIRQIETRYRVLFETTHEALLIVSAESGRVGDANSAAGRLLGRPARELAGRDFSGLFVPETEAALAATLARVREDGRERSVDVRARGSATPIGLDVLLFRSVNETLYLCRLTERADGGEAAQRGAERSLAALYGRGSDAMVFTDMRGRILHANTAFLSLTDVAVDEKLRDASLADFLGRRAADLDVMTTNAKAQGRLSVYATTLRSAYGASMPVEISATYLADAEPEGFGFVLRDVSRSAPSRAVGPTVSSDAVEHIIELVGSTPLKELVRNTTDVVEKLCIETAIKLTNNNRASAAEMLGLSRQSLYVKLRRYGLIDQED